MDNGCETIAQNVRALQREIASLARDPAHPPLPSVTKRKAWAILR